MTARTNHPRSELDCIHTRVRTERHTFRCADCGTRWTADFEIRDYVGPTGKRWVVHCRDGDPVPAPHFGAACPNCGLVSVTFVADGSQGLSTRPARRTTTG
jgi:predicted RNA-binding Zn-ribbon protein involved in translation (DUF1610 family)